MPAKLVSKGLKVLGYLVVAGILGFVLLPAIVVTVASFNQSAILAFPPKELSWRWYINAFSYADFGHGLRNSLVVTFWGSSIALLVGGAFGYALFRYEFRFRRTLEMILLSPLVIPQFTIGLGLLMLASMISVPRTYPLVVFTHTVIVLPFVLRSVFISLQNFNTRYESVAASLGASPGRVLTTVTIPLLLPGLLSGWLFAAILSFNEFTATLFVANQATHTLPVAMYNYVREYADPTLAALSVVYILATAGLLLAANAIFGLDKVFNVD
ncbi:ABC transporter permease [Roseibium marinum]|uniref:Putative spermidine/putrescine transport system permease protein n=1 Tax=Roseibium marinum TaxID=281252 RepID=A0A2S3UT84_9HYPH|nr:ABC transporter permease subunit [Roseibium marinum]POF30938.1 putative spermidine/putrescine transport system permease protein [Roseibium marinum]